MAWSTRELAELAGTTLRAVRHYHDVGVLDEPERTTNGYKQYGVTHLVTLIRIRRLVDVGIPLTAVPEFTGSTEDATDMLHRLLHHVEQDIVRLERNRDRLRALLSDEKPRSEFDTVLLPLGDHPLTEPDRLFMVVLVRLVNPRILDEYLAMMEATRHSPLLAEFDMVPADADDDLRAHLADRMGAHLTDVYAAFPALLDITTESPVGELVAKRALTATMEQLYNPAQIDILRRAASAER